MILSNFIFFCFFSVFMFFCSFITKEVFIEAGLSRKLIFIGKCCDCVKLALFSLKPSISNANISLPDIFLRLLLRPDGLSKSSSSASSELSSSISELYSSSSSSMINSCCNFSYFLANIFSLSYSSSSTLYTLLSSFSMSSVPSTASTSNKL